MSEIAENVNEQWALDVYSVCDDPEIDFACDQWVAVFMKCTDHNIHVSEHSHSHDPMEAFNGAAERFVRLHQALRDNKPKAEKCAACGSPARGFATINGRRYCHGDDDLRPTCYEVFQDIRNTKPDSRTDAP